MTLLEIIHDDALVGIRSAKAALAKLAAVCPDWVANEKLKIDIEQLERDIIDYGKHQLGLKGS